MHHLHRARSLPLWILLSLAAPGSAVAQGTPSAIDSLLDAPPFDRALWGVLIEDGPSDVYTLRRVR